MTQSELDHELITHILSIVKLKPSEKEVIEMAWLRICADRLELQATNNRRTKIFKDVTEALTQIRLDTKYLVFDLEATRRERDSLRDKL